MTNNIQYIEYHPNDTHLVLVLISWLIFEVIYSFFKYSPNTNLNFITMKANF